MKMKILAAFYAIISVFLIVTSVTAGDINYIKEYTYLASENDSKAICRTNALAQVKRLLLEELGTYLEGYTEVKNYELTKDKIISLTSGLVKTTIIDEKWDGRNYWIKASMTVDPEKVLKSIEESRENLKQDNRHRIKAGKEYRVSFYSASIQPGNYANDDSNPAPDSYVLVKDLSGSILFNTGDAYVKQKDVGSLLGNRNNYNPNFKGVGFNHSFNNDCILIYLVDWDGCEGLLCSNMSEDDIIGSKYKICTDDKTGKRLARAQGWEMEIEVLQID